MSQETIHPAIILNHRIEMNKDAAALVAAGKARFATRRDYALSGTPIDGAAQKALALSAKLAAAPAAKSKPAPKPKARAASKPAAKSTPAKTPLSKP